MGPRRVEQVHYNKCMQDMSFETLPELYSFLSTITNLMTTNEWISVIDILESYNYEAEQNGWDYIDYQVESNHDFRVLQFILTRAPIYKTNNKWHIKLTCD